MTDLHRCVGSFPSECATHRMVPAIDKAVEALGKDCPICQHALPHPNDGCEILVPVQVGDDDFDKEPCFCIYREAVPA